MAFAMMIAGCKKVDVDFTFSPSEPKAGEVVKFNNSSSAGENWNWDFGDNVTSVLKHPSHTFKKPGEYLVTLMVDSAKHNIYTRTITVYDTIPTFVASTDSICHYTDVVLTANVYNPFNYALTYQWNLPEECHLAVGTLESRSITVYFTKYDQKATVALTITQNGKVYSPEKTFDIYETKAPAIVMGRTKMPLRQRMINGYLEEPIDANSEDKNLLQSSSDTTVTFNGVTFYASKMQAIFPNHTILRLQMDKVEQKWYITTPEGLYVANFNGQHITLIDPEATGAIYVDAQRNRLYWATNSGLKAMPLIKSKNNQFATTPELYNNISDIDRIVVNNNLQ